jgi:phosphomannomutase
MPVPIEVLRSLQNGSDIRGVAMKQGDTPVNLTDEAVAALAFAFAQSVAALCQTDASLLRIGVGHDPRLTAHAMRDAAFLGLSFAKAEIFDCGLASTPAMFMSTVFEETNFDAAIMITASHLPADRNGMKFFTRCGGLDSRSISELIERASQIDVPKNTPTAPQSCDLMEYYSRHLRQSIIDGVRMGEQPLKGLKIAVDAGNGSAGFFVDRVLGPLGADTTGSRYLEPDGNFPNHIPNPENLKALEAARQATADSGADLGLAFDTDVDRMAAVLPDGRLAARDCAIALMAAVLAPDNPGATIVTDSVTSNLLTEFLQDELGLVHRRFKRGYNNIINEAKRLESKGISVPMAIETSGHCALRENYFLDDGAYMAVKIIIAAARVRMVGGTLGSLIAKFRLSAEGCEVRIPIKGSDPGDYAAIVLAEFEARAKKAKIVVVPGFEGVRLRFFGEAQGWLLLRMSLHDPLMPLNIEGENPGDCQKIVDTAKKLLQGFSRLDLSGLGDCIRPLKY